ncbi:UNVERIFIED_CONTAM: COBRA-like protein 1 [Sesamum angustifolium]|uniref:COBRA-like protein 1 n=1 Tax=Sesamum angustifolium TaxID=2727405 RepID=A0AAW2QCR3_9LAMI
MDHNKGTFGRGLLKLNKKQELYKVNLCRMEFRSIIGFSNIYDLRYCYDPLDPNGNITVTFDIHKYTLDGYAARVTIQNYYQYRHVEKPGWKLGWTWAKDEVIWSMTGAFAIQRGNCSSFKYEVPHSCKPDPVIVDLMPNAMPQNKSDGCCRGGILASWAIDPSMSYSSFELVVGNLEQNSTGYKPLNLTLLAPGPGYTCGPVTDTSPTVFSVIGGRRQEEVFRTWKSTCTYSSYLASKTPVCCVSLSTFYSPTITSCPSCSCGCRVADQFATSCIRQGVIPSNLLDVDLIQCTDHMCPLRIHWHIKKNYITHWRVKLTISNYNYGRNYSNWNVLVQHPGFGQPSASFSFNSTMLPTTGVPEDVALFWGKAFYNTELLQADQYQVGSVTTEILLQKDSSSFTLSNGWALPRRIYFNATDRSMAPPPGDKTPSKVNQESTPNSSISSVLFVIAMQTEALPLVDKFQLAEQSDSLFPEGVPWMRVDSVGTVSASLLTYASVQALQPDLIINAGTAGGFKEKGASIGDVYLVSDVAFHDRRIPVPVLDLYGVGSRQAFPTPNLVKELKLKVGKLSTGDSLDMTPQDAALILANNATVKDMEGAAVAYAADLLKVPVIFIKAVTDIVDGNKPTSEEFLQNLAAVVAALDKAATKVVDFINGKTFSEL